MKLRAPEMLGLGSLTLRVGRRLLHNGRAQQFDLSGREALEEGDAILKPRLRDPRVPTEELALVLGTRALLRGHYGPMWRSSLAAVAVVLNTSASRNLVAVMYEVSSCQGRGFAVIQKPGALR